MKKTSIILFSFISLLFANISYGSDFNFQKDSVIKLLNNTTDTEQRLEHLQALVEFIPNDPSVVKWLTIMQKEASQAQQYDKKGWAIRNLARFYYNTENLDSLNLCVSYMDALTKETGEYSNYYYDVYTFLCQYILWHGELERAADIAIRIYNLAKEQNNINGIICNCETMGLINQRMNRDSIAVDFFREGLELLEKQPNEHRFVVQFLTNIIESELRINQLEKANEYIIRLEKQLNDIKAGRFGDEPAFPYDRCYMLMNIYCCDLNIRKKEVKEAKKYLDKSATFRSKVEDGYVQFYHLFNATSYFQLTKQYPIALAYADTIIQLDPQNSEVWRLRGDILFEMGNTREAALQYLDAFQQNEQMNTEAFTRQLGVLHTLHDMNNLELQVKELRVKELELNVKQQQLYWTYSLIVLLSVFILLVSILYLHTRRLKNELQRDKLALQESEKNLRIARDQAQESDRLKSLFLSNMSHEIRTPLNAIVGFSDILADSMDETDERKEYTHIITENADLLLNLVNDILDISRLESERYRFTFQSQNLSECCQSALTSVMHRVKPGVELKFVPEDEHFSLYTDKLRLQQVIINLVGNAAKFTDQGSIELAFRVNQAEQMVYFTVTDTGCGIPPEKQDSIFERFEKLNEHVQGTGLGLSICKIISQRFQGDITIDKNYTNGARFVFTHSMHCEADE